ncbi:MAG: integrase, partial [Terriglobia bacterium]
MQDDSQQLAAPQGGEATTLALVSKAQDFLRQSLAANTLRAYASDWRHFTRWCQANTRIPLPALPETVSLYL